MEYRLGIDLGGTAFKIGLVDGDYNIVGRTSAPTNQFSRSFSEVVADMADAAQTLAEQAGHRLQDLTAVGIGTPGCVNPHTGLLMFAGNFNWHRAPLRQELEDRLGVPVRIGNDANCAIIGETLAGAARGHRNVLMLTLGTGLGGGLILDGKLFIGGDGMGAELGHTPLVFNGAPCTCGIRGCFEAYASVTGLIRLTREAMEAHPGSALHAHAAQNDGRVTGRTAFDCAKQGDVAALEVIDAYISYLAAGIGGFVNTFRPEIVLIGGGISHEGSYLLDPMNERLGAYVFAGAQISAPKIIAAHLENDAGIIGAACLDMME